MADLPEILIVEDSITLAQTYRAYLEPLPVSVAIALTGAEARRHLANSCPDVMLLDLKLPDTDGLTLMREIQAQGLSPTIVVITAHGSVKTAVQAMQDGAADFLLKPFDADRLQATVRNMLQVSRLSDLVARYEEQTSSNAPLQNLMGDSPEMKAVYQALRNAGPSRAPVFLVGESGTGKELCAEAVHHLSPRHGRPFVPLNCAAIPRDLIESEIFGYKKGAFTGATSDRDGAAIRANGGTLFLDEICEMDLSLQGKLLRFIQSGRAQPVGGDTSREVDIRFVCATNKDPWTEVQAGRFREDLYFRLHVIPITVPPLRLRGDDCLLLAEAFLREFSEQEGKRFTGFSAEAETLLQTYPWPGNVRELRNAIHNVVVLNSGGEVTSAMMPAQLQNGAMARPSQPGDVVGWAAPDAGELSPLLAASKAEIMPLAEVERLVIEQAIALCDGNVTQAAGRLEVSPSTLYRKLQSWQDHPKVRSG